MPPNRIAQTSTEVKKAYKKNGPAISERTHKQLERGYELEQRAAREREAEKRRKAAREKREEKERKEKTARQQLGVGLATQLIGYSHTQANLKKGMEAFLGVGKQKQDDAKRRKDEEKRREEELARKLEVIAQDIEKEPFDDDEDMDDVMLDLPVLNEQSGERWDEDLDDDTLLEVHDLVMTDPVEEPANESISVPARLVTAPPTPQAAAKSPRPSKHPLPDTNITESGIQSSLLAEASRSRLPKPAVSEDLEFTRTHGPMNKAVEAALGNLPGEIIELLSQDTVTLSSDWNPAQGLLYKLNPIGLPPHRLRIKVGCVVVCLRDLNTSSQLSKSQHVRVLRVENERLECLTLDGQLAGTKTVITRVPFAAKYRNDSRFPFTRTQYPVRVATDYVLPDIPREPAHPGFKLPSINGRTRPSAPVKRATPPLLKPRNQASLNPSFKLPALPASKAQSARIPKPSASVNVIATAFSGLDGWDNFLESGTQIARELSAEIVPQESTSKTSKPLPAVESVPPLSTQDFDFSLNDLDDEPEVPPVPVQATIVTGTTKTAVPARIFKPPPSVRPGPLSRTANIRRIDPDSDRMPSPARPLKSVQLNHKRQMAPPPQPTVPAKRTCIPLPTLASSRMSTVATKKSDSFDSFDDFGMSTQDATFFFDDDDDLGLGSPPIAV